MSGGNDLIDAIAAEQMLQTGPERWRRYAELLEKPTTSQADIQEMKELVRGLGLRTEAMRKHQEVLAIMRSWESAIARAAGIGPSIEKATAAAEKFREETKAILAKRNEEGAKLFGLAAELSGQLSAADGLLPEIAKLKQEYPRLLAHMAHPSRAGLASGEWNGFGAKDRPKA